MDDFARGGCKDIHFPYSEDGLPDFLMDRNSRQMFLEKQAIALSGKLTEFGEGRSHQYYSEYNHCSLDIKVEALNTMV